MKYKLSEEADQDLDDIYEYYWLRNPAKAEEIEQEIYKACDFLCEYPFSGSLRFSEADSNVRAWNIIWDYQIIYSPEARPLEIVRILHSARNIGELLGNF